jgi:hypothetical protein
VQPNNNACWASFLSPTYDNRKRKQVKKMKKQKGVVLFITLVFLSIISLLLSYSLHAVYMQKTLNHYQRRQLILDQQAKLALVFVFNRMKSGEACFYPKMTSSEVMKQSASWWEKRCHAEIDNMRVNYFFTRLQEADCIYLKQKPVDFYSLTLKLSLPSQVQQIIQATVAVPRKEMVECEGPRQQLKQAWQSIRILRE